MPRAKYEDICADLRSGIIEGRFKSGMLPTEAILTERYGASRNTVRRAIANLARAGFVQSIRGRGVVILDRPATVSDVELDIRDISGAKSISNAAIHSTETKVLGFTKVEIDGEMGRKTGLPTGAHAYQLQRLRICDGHPWIVDHNLFLCDIVRDLTFETAERSIYRYLENDLGLRVVGSRRTLAIRKADDFDREHLELDGCNCVGVIYNNAFIDDGRLFEFTETRYSPEHFTFTEFVER